MPEELPTDNLCPNCDGTGLVNGEPDILCSGTGYASTLGIGIFNKWLRTMVGSIEEKVNDANDKCDDIIDKCNDIFEKCEEIFDEVKS